MFIMNASDFKYANISQVTLNFVKEDVNTIFQKMVSAIISKQVGVNY